MDWTYWQAFCLQAFVLGCGHIFRDYSAILRPLIGLDWLNHELGSSRFPMTLAEYAAMSRTLKIYIHNIPIQQVDKETNCDDCNCRFCGRKYLCHQRPNAGSIETIRNTLKTFYSHRTYTHTHTHRSTLTHLHNYRDLSLVNVGCLGCFAVGISILRSANLSTTYSVSSPSERDGEGGR